MKRFVSSALAAFILFCLVIATARPAYGDVDPGSGLMALQGAATAAAAFGFFLRRRIRMLFSRTEDDRKEVEPVTTKVESSAKPKWPQL